MQRQLDCGDTHVSYKLVALSPRLPFKAEKPSLVPERDDDTPVSGAEISCSSDAPGDCRKGDGDDRKCESESQRILRLGSACAGNGLPDASGNAGRGGQRNRHAGTTPQAHRQQRPASAPTPAKAAASEDASPLEVARRTLERRAAEAVIWGMPAVNCELMLQEMFSKTAGKITTGPSRVRSTKVIA